MTGGIQNFYNGKTVFITGASGFMGKVLLEKLMYSCSELKEIFILMRPKREKTGAQRVLDFEKIPVFSFIKIDNKTCFQILIFRCFREFAMRNRKCLRKSLLFSVI